MNKKIILQSLMLGALFINGLVFAQFTETGFDQDGINAMPYLNTGPTTQTKTGDLIADFLTARNKWCLGTNNNDCITKPWKVFSPTSCRLEAKTIWTTAINLDVQMCDDLLSIASKNAGWVSSGGDNCNGTNSGNCGHGQTCVYTRLYCTGGGITNINTAYYNKPTGPIAHPVTFATYPLNKDDILQTAYNLTWDPQCNDGIDNPLDTFDNLIDGADPQCRHAGDNDEVVL